MDELDIENISAQEKLELIGTIWDTLDSDGVSVPHWQIRLLEERIAEYRREGKQEQPEIVVAEELLRTLEQRRAASA